MAKKTLLEITQDILSDMNGDEVNSINDTAESLQVATLVRSSYDNILSGKDYPHQNELIQLEASGSTAKPTHMHLPEGLLALEFLKYNKKVLAATKELYMDVTFMKPLDFVNYLNNRLSSDTNVISVLDDGSVELLIKNDKAPTYYTSFDDEWIVFDSYDSAVDTTLQESKVQAFGKVIPVFTMEDGFIPDLPMGLFPYLINEAKSTCFIVLKEMQNSKAEQHSITQRRQMSQDAWRLKKGIDRPDYGRKSRK